MLHKINQHSPQKRSAGAGDVQGEAGAPRRVGRGAGARGTEDTPEGRAGRSCGWRNERRQDGAVICGLV